ncbi:MAG: SAM-dependent methyltransferase [Proteobacteria bacterium]|nr:SAM-dependent methyltransferase [Pseudomonadota bacterium]
MTALGELIAARIARLGAITVADYMAEAVAHPDHGYYMSGDPFGARGDFVTAPEISQMFGELIGLWCADTWARMGGPEPVLLVELGPGRGTLMADALRAARVTPGFGAALRLHFVEISPALRARQGQTVAQSADAARPTWHESLDQVPDGPLLLVANEFFDALPIRQFEKRPEGWCERLVTLAPDGETFAFALAPPGPQAAALLPAALRAAAPGAVAEVSAPAIAIAGEIGRRLATGGGAALIIDYGHAEPRTGATLQAVRRHAAHPVLEDPGAADLTAHVDFAMLARAATEAGARAHGPVPQGRFLEALGIGARARALGESATPDQAREIASALHRLTHPREMGELFKVLALAHPDLGPPAGFS